MSRLVRRIIEGARAMAMAIGAAGNAAVVIVLMCVLFGAAFYFFGDDSSSYEPVSPEVEAYTPLIQKYADEYGIPQYTELIKAVMMQESGAVEFSKQQAKKHGWSSYGDPDYVEHVLRYYPYGNYSYDVINTGPGKLQKWLKGAFFAPLNLCSN